MSAALLHRHCESLLPFLLLYLCKLSDFLIGQNDIHLGHLGCGGFEDKWIKLDFTRACLVRFLS